MNAYAQTDEINLEDALKAKLIAEKDTLSLSRPISLTLILTNQSKKPVYIPSNFTQCSNLFPNGTTDDRSGGSIEYQLTPSDKFASVYEENLTSRWPKTFIKIRPHSSHIFKVNIIPDINEFNTMNAGDSSQVKTNSVYKLTLTYSNHWQMKGNEANTFLGEIKSNDVKFLLIK